MIWYIYILRCSDGSFYTGLTNELNKRVEDHISGRGAQYTRFRRPASLEYYEQRGSKKDAEKREKEIKKLSKTNKEHLIKYGAGKRVSLASDD